MGEVWQGEDIERQGPLIGDAVSIKVGLGILSLLVLLLPACATAPEKAKVIQVIDGDTIVIEGGYHVRYIGIDTPEVYPELEPYGIEAKQYNQELVEGKVVRLERDEEGEGKDKYGRLLRYVYVDDIFVNAELVRMGYAEVYPKGLFPEIQHYDELKAAEEEAREEGRGNMGKRQLISFKSYYLCRFEGFHIDAGYFTSEI